MVDPMQNMRATCTREITQGGTYATNIIDKQNVLLGTHVWNPVISLGSVILILFFFLFFAISRTALNIPTRNVQIAQFANSNRTLTFLDLSCDAR